MVVEVELVVLVIVTAVPVMILSVDATPVKAEPSPEKLEAVTIPV